MNLILTYLIDLSRTHKHSLYLLFLICPYSDRYNAHLCFKRQAKLMLLHHSLTVKVLIGA